MNNNTWHLLTVFLLTGKAADGIMAELVKAGYGVKSGNIEKAVWGNGRASAMLTLMVQSPDQDQPNINQVRNRLSPIINKAKHFGWVVSSDASLHTSNIKLNSLPQKHKPEPRPIHMKLLPPGPMATFIESVEAGKNEEDDTND
jgi:hypothetical protein